MLCTRDATQTTHSVTHTPAATGNSKCDGAAAMAPGAEAGADVGTAGTVPVSMAAGTTAVAAAKPSLPVPGMAPTMLMDTGGIPMAWAIA